MEKLQDWLVAAERFRSCVSDEDEVFAVWNTLLSDFFQHLPLLLKLSHKALTVKSLFSVPSAYRRRTNHLGS